MLVAYVPTNFWTFHPSLIQTLLDRQCARSPLAYVLKHSHIKVLSGCSKHMKPTFLPHGWINSAYSCCYGPTGIKCALVGPLYRTTF